MKNIEKEAAERRKGGREKREKMVGKRRNSREIVGKKYRWKKKKSRVKTYP